MSNRQKVRLWNGVSSVGTALFGITTASQFTDISTVEKRVLWYISILGFVLSSVGKFMAPVYEFPEDT